MGPLPRLDGLGYDPLYRDSNSFIETIMRKNGLKAPWYRTFLAVGFDNTFDAWTWWDIKLQQVIARAARAKIGF
jgi:hypothetical protein